MITVDISNIWGDLCLPDLLAKIIMDALLFVVSYRAQNKLVFKKK